MGILSQDMIEKCRIAFDKHDMNHNGYIEVEDLKAMYRELGMQVNDLDIKNMIAGVDIDGDGVLSFDEFVKVVESGGLTNSQAESDYDTLLAFVTMGGQEDMTGHVDANKLRKVVQDFGLTIDLDALLKQLDENGDGEISFEEFRHILTGPQSPVRPRTHKAEVLVDATGDRFVGRLDQHGLVASSFSPFEPQQIQQVGYLSNSGRFDRHDEPVSPI